MPRIKFSKYEQKMLDRIKAAGGTLKEIPDDDSMMFVLRISSTVGLHRANSELGHLLEAEIVRDLEGKSLKTKIPALGVSAQIMDPIIAQSIDGMTIRRDGSVSVGLAIDHVEWSRAPIAKQIQLLADCVSKSIGLIKKSRLPENDRDIILKAVDHARDALIEKSDGLGDEQLRNMLRIQ